MAWVIITEADVLTHISGSELEALRAVALKTGQVDPVQPSIDQATATVRGYVAACRENKLDTTTTKIPDRLLDAACDMIVAIIIGRVPGYDLDEGRQDKNNAAMKLLRDVGACKFSIEDPVTGEEQSGSIEVVDSTTRQTTRAQLNGL